jgi:hypothetical protein
MNLRDSGPIETISNFFYRDDFPKFSVDHTVLNSLA